MGNILAQVTLNKYSPRKDKSCSLNFVTDLEVSSEEISKFHDCLDQRGILYFKIKGNLTQEEVDELDEVDIELEGKTKSQRLRNVLYVLHKETNSQQDFKDFYSQKMESLITHFKGQIPEE